MNRGRPKKTRNTIVNDGKKMGNLWLQSPYFNKIDSLNIKVQSSRWRTQLFTQSEFAQFLIDNGIK